jgi:hypothetical protein
MGCTLSFPRGFLSLAARARTSPSHLFPDFSAANAWTRALNCRPRSS